jgi:pSer/pThr/pTyr-binding forkhead associated (FHA) protein
MLMGRHSDADVRLPLPDVSRRHCRFLFTDGAWEVFDLDSLNGIFINGERLKHAVLRDQDVLTVGGFHFQVDLSGTACHCLLAPPGVYADSGLPGGASSGTPNAEEFIHRIAHAFPETTPDSESQRKAS